MGVDLSYARISGVKKRLMFLKKLAPLANFITYFFRMFLFVGRQRGFRKNSPLVEMG